MEERGGKKSTLGSFVTWVGHLGWSLGLVTCVDWASAQMTRLPSQTGLGRTGPGGWTILWLFNRICSKISFFYDRTPETRKLIVNFLLNSDNETRPMDLKSDT